MEQVAIPTAGDLFDPGITPVSLVSPALAGRPLSDLWFTVSSSQPECKFPRDGDLCALFIDITQMPLRIFLNIS